MKTKSFRWVYAVLVGLLSLAHLSMGQTPSNPLKGQRVLVFSKTKGYRHGSIPQGIAAIKLMGRKYGFDVDTTENAERFNEDNLKRYRVVVFLSTTGDVLDDRQQIAFERFIQAGGGYAGVHAATDTEYDWPWYGKFVGGYFASHPGNPNVQMGTMNVTNPNHPATDSLPATFQRKDEFYDFKQFNKDVNVLITVDEKSYKDGKMGDYHPMAWYQEYDGGRMFYTNFGHTDETFMEPLFLQHFWGGLRWAASGAKALDYSKARSAVAPEENRFSREVLDEKLYEPTELAVMDDGRVIYGERHGKLKLYNPKAKQKVKVIAELPVYDKFEYGLMGVGLDPKFNENHFVYLYYSPSAAVAKGDTAQRLSRFVFDPQKDTLLLSTEKIVLRVPVKRTDCCHTGGSIDWDKVGNLYLSTGDDVNPFASDGYGPIDNRPGRAGWDGRASSSNTNDLRGKILRIKPQPDGSYAIPEGNLFPAGTERARPEIYVMGCRNPYRISVDKRTGFLYWGEVGPDAGENSEKYGPRGHDEVNQARKAGYFGWPLFVADNRAYNQRNFETGETSSKFDPAKPINDSPHNTGLRELPPAQKAFIYYPYADSPEFGPIVGKGGRNAMGGPVYYSEDFDANSKVKFPKYYDGKFFAYDWMRDWINIVTMKPNGDFASMERFMPSWKFSHPMDMAFAKDGSLYMLEYGPNWFAQNDEARLTRITYNAGNRAPVAVASVSKSAGAAPLKVAFSSKGSLDYDGDAIKYEWTLDKGVKSTLPNPTHTYSKAGVYRPVLKVIDSKGNMSTQVIEVKVGNEPPKVELLVKGNQSFYFDDQPVEYEVRVSDKEDGSLANKKIAEDEVMVDINFLQGFDKTMIAQGHQMNTSFASGKRLIELSDCKACHSVDQKSIGPAYREIAKKYKGGFEVEGKLSDKIIKGGGGVWGEQAMSAHPQISKDDAKEMVRYIMSLGSDKKSKPLKGTYVTKSQGKEGNYLFTASYTDKGKGGLAPLTGSGTLTLRSAKLSAVSFDVQSQTTNVKVPQLGNRDVVVAGASGAYIAFKGIDLSGISGLSIGAMSMQGTTAGGKIEIRSGSPSGTLLGEATVGEAQMAPLKAKLSASSGVQDLYLVFVNQSAGSKPLFAVDSIVFERDAIIPAPTGGK